MTLKAYALTTVSRLAAFLGVSSPTPAQQTLFEYLINASTEMIENYIGFRVKKSTVTQEEYNTDKSGIITLNRFPLTATAVTVQRRLSGLNEDNWETIDSQYYHIDRNAGIIYGAGGYTFERSRDGYRVSYEAGYDFDNSTTYLGDTEGGDIELACWMLCNKLYNSRGDSVGVKRESIGDYSIEYFDSKLSQSLIDSDIAAILDNYAAPALAGTNTPYVY